MNPQRFRSLRERTCNAAVFLIACASVGVALFSAPAFADQIENLKKFKDECGKEGADPLVIYIDRKADELVEDYKPEIQCKENSGEESPALSYNSRQVSPDVWNKRPGFLMHSKNETEARKLGACRAVYRTMKEIYDRVQRLSVDYCADVKADFDKALVCGGLEKKCEGEFRRAKETLGRHTNIRDEVIRAATYLQLTMKVSDEARVKYVKDLELLEQEIRNNSTVLGNPLERMTSLADHPEVKASNGNARTKNLGDYYKLLVTNEINHAVPLRSQLNRFGGRLISEQREAGRQATEFLNKLHSQMTQQASTTRLMLDQIEAMIAGIDKNGSIKDPGLTGKINTLAPAATGALGLGQQVLGGGNNQTAPAALTGGSSAPSLATLAAVGAAGAALHSSLGRSSSSNASASDPIDQQAAAKPLAPTQTTTNLGDTGSKGGTGNTGNTDLPGSAKTDTAKVDPVAPASGAFPAFGASEGSSRMLAGSKKTSQTPRPAEAKASAGGDEAFNSFGGGASMAPKPAPKGAQVSAGAEVANLLGQMKNLFNFDEGAPVGGASNTSGGMPVDPGLPASGSIEEQVAEADGALGSEDEVAAGDAPTAEHVQGSPFGKTDTTLFTRVHSRHKRCMERGLVLYQLGERVE